MKKYLFIMSAVALAMASCSEEQELVNAPVNQANRVLTATFEQEAATRTSIATENNSLTWSANDDIAVFGTGENEQAQYILTNGVGTTSATFTLSEEVTAPEEIVGAAFPHSQANWSNGALTMNLLANLDQTTASELDLPMWGTVTDGNIAFKHLAGVLKVNLTDVPEGYTKLIVTASNPISGPFTATEIENELVLTSESTADENKTVTVEFANGEPTTLYLPLPVGEYESIMVSVSNGTNIKVLKKFSNIEIKRATVNKTSANISTYVTTESELREAVTKVGTVNLGADITITEPLVISAAVTLNGNNFTIENTTTGTDARAINVNVNGEVTIKNLTVVAAGERAINVIQQPAKLTLDNVTATAVNYALNVASSASTNATNAENAPTVTIENSTLTGGNTINLTGRYVTATIRKSTINCVDNSAATANDFGAISISDASNVHVTVDEETEINVTEGSDSFAAQILADDTNTITFPTSSTYEVICKVAMIPSGNYAAGYTTLEAALNAAQSGETVKLVNNVTLTSTITVAAEKNIILDLNGKTITISKKDGATGVTDFQNHGTMTIKNGAISAGDDELTRRCIYNYGTMIIDGVNFTQSYGQKGAAINNEGTMTIQGETTVDSKYYSIWNSGTDTELTIEGGTFTTKNIENADPCYCVNNINGATLIVNDGTFTGDHGAIGLSDNGSTATLNKGTFTCEGIVGKSDHVIYVPTGTTLTYSETNCIFDNKNDAASDNGGKQIYDGGGTINKIQ